MWLVTWLILSIICAATGWALYWRERKLKLQAQASLTRWQKIFAEWKQTAEIWQESARVWKEASMVWRQTAETYQQSSDNWRELYLQQEETGEDDELIN